MSRKARILLYESDLTILQMMKFNFEMEGFEVFDAASSDEILSRVLSKNVDIVVLHWGEGSENCLDICKSIRATSSNFYVPVVIISAAFEETDRIAAYRQGADDLVIKPYSLPELLARIRAILRRTSPAIGGRIIRAAGVEVDIDNARVKRDGMDVRLSATEFKILRYLMENAGKVRSREQIRNAVWGRDGDVDIRAVDVRITRLRRRLNGDGQPDVIRTIRSVGYALGDQSARQRADMRMDMMAG